MCERLHCLPFRGGLLQQPSWVFKRLRTVIVIQDQLNELETKKKEGQAELKSGSIS